jgi:hypothetical protein
MHLRQLAKWESRPAGNIQNFDSLNKLEMLKEEDAKPGRTEREFIEGRGRVRVKQPLDSRYSVILRSVGTG